MDHDGAQAELVAQALISIAKARSTGGLFFFTLSLGHKAAGVMANA